MTNVDVPEAKDAVMLICLLLLIATRDEYFKKSKNRVQLGT